MQEFWFAHGETIMTTLIFVLAAAMTVWGFWTEFGPNSEHNDR